MKLLIFLTFPILFLFSCVNVESEVHDDGPGLQSYHQTEPGMADGGVQVIPVETPSGTFNVWTKRVGNNPSIKVLLLHGGPGGTHEYLESFDSFLPQEGIEFIYYDQLGSARSDQPDDTTLWVTERFVEEVEQVRQALDLDSDNFYLLGHSWGGILGIEYALKYQDNLKGLIISNMVPSIPDYNVYANTVLAERLGEEVVTEVRALEAAGDYTSDRYMELLIPHHYEKHVLRRPAEEWPEPVDRSFSRFNQDIYVRMQGPSEFGASGVLLEWDRKADLSKITVPTLSIGAEWDTMDPEQMEWMAGQVQNGTYLHCPGGSHMAMWDAQDSYFPGLISWLKAVDG
jgi:proline iminopeptidase